MGTKRQIKQPPRLDIGPSRELSTLPDDGPWECQKQLPLFITAERFTTNHVDRRRNVWSPDIEGADEIRTVLGWCETCRNRDACLSDMTYFKYTGIAGGEILNKGIPVPKESDES
ncbi:hypothetical protein MAHJHV58_31840 [Mycobacterium avium subsp. hominissuis]|uniref:hypothetical protein n=1 Tax=Mycobacterium avium TaxID=1764 RepID=UPI00045023D9|nr:hypothetical protein [Mycobacterium avium]ETZ55271.1 hypothetical protein L838_0927 [Mycobacterium avium MAV_120709_2344]MCA4741564.1 hypothetical protein [Mycobacterium avium subsp. hominissuis]MCA4746214.1 hypothetical protein [Mycobacterium avium subsp. hominissuis]MCA4766626.1 hypothetical protein [Mycobacterium avium subsp. hominissuis]MDO2387062.1 hypothetical protein [Mycobacterium avium subsp. hominissuis]